MSEQLTIGELVERVLAELSRLDYAQNTQSQYRRFYHRVVLYAGSRGVNHYSEAFGREFFEATYGCPWTEMPQPTPARFRPPVRFLASLSDVQLHGTVVRRRPKNRPYEAPPAFQEALTEFAVECQRRGYSAQGQRTRMDRLRVFLAFLSSENVTPDTLTAQHVSRYAATLLNYNPKTVLAVLTCLRTFLRFLRDAGFHALDLSGSVPRVRSGRYERLPSVWPSDTVQRLLNAVDRGNPTGKRDYAILLLAARLGMRVGDMKSLTLSALRWEAKTIAWVQQKTGRFIEYPLLDDVGWAIIDYLQHGRPETASPVLFVRHHAPFAPFGQYANLHHIITRYVRQAGISVPTAHRGLHVLRHTLASTLLERNTPLAVIAQVLGHLSTQSTQVYLAVDRAGLQRCALDPEEVFSCADQ